MQQVPKHAAALEIVLDLATDPVLLCSAARVCTSWRTAVAASGAGTTDVVWSASCSDASGDVLLQRLDSFVSWFQVHAHLVRSLQWVDFRHQSAAQRAVANLLLAQGLQLAAAGPKPPRLQSFESDTISTHLLAALPDTVTELQLEFGDECDLQPGMLTAACRRLHKLQQLSLWHSNCPRESEEPPTLSVSFLPHLTLLKKLSLTCELLEVSWCCFRRLGVCLCCSYVRAGRCQVSAGCLRRMSAALAVGRLDSTHVFRPGGRIKLHLLTPVSCAP